MPARPRQGGQILRSMQTPLSFFLELLAILLLVLAAAGPALVKTDVARPLVVVLDDSYSMLARRTAGERTPPSPRKAAETALTAELARDNYLARFLLAGAEPRLLGQPLRPTRPTRLAARPGGLDLPVPTADLQRAIALAAEIGGPAARILVLSDHAPPMTLEGGQVQWWAFGSKLPNMAITAAAARGVGREPAGDAGGEPICPTPPAAPC